MQNEPLVVYSVNDCLFSTFCEFINEIFIPSSFSECTNDLPIYIFNNSGNNKTVLYLTRANIIRNTSVIIECYEEPDYFYISKKIVIRKNKTAQLYDKKINFTNIFNISQKIINFNNSAEDFGEYYFQYLNKNKIFVVIRDIINYIFMGIFIICGKNKYIIFN